MTYLCEPLLLFVEAVNGGKVRTELFVTLIRPLFTAGLIYLICKLCKQTSWLLHITKTVWLCNSYLLYDSSLSLHRALRRVTWSVHQPMHTLKLFILKLLKMLRHVLIIRPSTGSCLFLAKITLLKTFTAWFSYTVKPVKLTTFISWPPADVDHMLVEPAKSYLVCV